MVDNKRFIKNLLMQILSIAFSLLINFFLTPFLIKNLGVGVYGFVGLANDFVSYLDIATIALNSMAARFITISLEKKDIELANKQFNSVLFGNSILMGIVFIPSVFFICNLEKFFKVDYEYLLDIKLLWGMIFLGFVLTCITSVFGIAAFSKNRLYVLSNIKIGSNIIKAVLLYALFSVFCPHVYYIGLVTLLCTLYVFMINRYYTARLLPEMEIKYKHFSSSEIITICSAGSWMIINKLSGLLAKGFDLLLSNFFISSYAMGTLLISRVMPAVALSFLGQTSSVFAPRVISAYARNDISFIYREMIFSMKLLGIISSAVLAIIFGIGKEFYQLWVPSQDVQYLYKLTMVGCIDLVFALPQESFWNIMMAANKVRLPTLTLLAEGGLSLIIVIVSMSAVSDDEIKLIIIAGVSSFFGMIRSLLFMPVYAAYCLKIDWKSFYPIIVKNSVLFLLACFLIFLLTAYFEINTWAEFILLSLISTLLVALCGYIILLDKEDRCYINRSINRYISKEV